MIRLGTSPWARMPQLVQESPLRRADPRAKLALSLLASMAVMLPLERLAAFMVLYALLLLWARLLPSAGRQIWRAKWLLCALFALDWWLVGLDLAVLVSLRLVLLTGVFTLLVSTTSSSELCLALEALWIPYRYAFSLGLAFQSVGLLESEWRAIREAQRARGAWQDGGSGRRRLLTRVRDLVALTVPSIVLTTRRAWSMTEAAYARGFDSPHRHPYRQLRMGRIDWLLLAGAAIVGAALWLWR